MGQPQLSLPGYQFSELFEARHLARLDADFLNHLQLADASLYSHLLEYRHQSRAFTRDELNTLLLGTAPYLSQFIAEFFSIETETEALSTTITRQNVIFSCKEWFVQREAKRRLAKPDPNYAFAQLDNWLDGELLASEIETADREWAIAYFAEQLRASAEPDPLKMELLINWFVLTLSTAEGQKAVAGWALFKLPHRVDLEALVPVETTLRQRDGFSLTDQGMDQRHVLSEVHYCVYCHKNDGDFCSKGFPVKKREPELGLKKNALDEFLTGCPLEEKISEMHSLYRDGDVLGALAMVMVDNPMCAATGHRICNDCMKACIYQKQDPVNIPEIESRVLKESLALPWGVEIYDLLMRWNPLRQAQWVLQPYNGLKVMVMGMGPAGFTLAHHLLMEGCAVIGVDGLKVEPIAPHLLDQPIYDFNDLREDLAERIMAGFGGVAEYGITVRWDKNYLKLIYLTLARRRHFSVYGGVRFGGTFTVEDVWALGCDHLAIAVGAGLPKELAIPGSMAPGMRQANDFLMALQLTGAAKKSSLANLQIRLPAVVIGGGLTAIDTATEVQAYYLAQVEKTLWRYETLIEKWGETEILRHFKAVDVKVLQEFLTHGRAVRAERARALAEKRGPDFIGLLRQWGGVTIVYRRSMQESPAYKRNHEEIIKALEEGIFYAEHLSPVAARLDEIGHVSALVCHQVMDNAEVVLPAKAIFVATGARPNIAYEFEHRGTFHREGTEYRAYQEDTDQNLHMVHPPLDQHSKIPEFGPFTSYDHGAYRISFLGDTHPVFHGSVVKAIASAQRIYPKIIRSLQKSKQLAVDENEYQDFALRIQDLFKATVVKVVRHTESVIEVQVCAKMAAHNFHPGQFYRVQNFETAALIVGGTRLQSEAMAMIGAEVDRATGLISFMVLEQGASSRLFATFKSGQPISIMGPTGVRTRIPTTPETVMVIGGRLGAAQMQAIGPALRAAGHRVLYVAGFRHREEVYNQQTLEKCADVIVWITENGEPISPNRPQDVSATGDFVELLAQYAQGKMHANHPPPIPINSVHRVLVTGSSHLVKKIQSARQSVLKSFFMPETAFIASIYGPMQCMLKGVCAQCLQWQIDPETGQRTKAVFACSWQDQPMDIVDFRNLDERLAQNHMQEILTNLWLDYLFAEYEVNRI